jgi:hypothetical protein
MVKIVELELQYEDLLIRSISIVIHIILIV